MIMRESIAKLTEDQKIDLIQSLYNGTLAGIAGMEGRNYTGVGRKPKTKKEAAAAALSYCKAVINDFNSLAR